METLNNCRRPVSFIERFCTIVDRTPDAAAIETHNSDGELVSSISYGDLQIRMEVFRYSLRELGLGDGDTALLILPNGVDFVAAFYALASLGVTTVPLSPRLKAFELKPVVRDSQPTVVLTQTGPSPDLLRALEECDKAPVLFCTQPSKLVSTATEQVVLKTKSRSSLSNPSGNPTISCHFTYKGLGYPLGAEHSASDFDMSLDCGMKVYPLQQGTPVFVGLPLYHIFGFGVTIIQPLSFGCRLVMVDRPHKLDLYRFFMDNHIGYGAAVPEYIKLMLFQKQHFGGERRLPQDLILFTGGAYLDAATTDLFADSFGAVPSQGYGLCEGFIVSANRLGRNRSGTLGLPLSDQMKVSIRDVNGSPLSPGKDGEIFLRGPWISKRFLRRPKESEMIISDGWLCTGDLGHVDEDGHLHYTGRKIDAVKIRSQMVDLLEVKAALREHPLVSDVRVTVRRDPFTGDTLRAWIIPAQSNLTISKEDLRVFCEKRLSSHKIPRDFSFWKRRYAVSSRVA